VEWKPDAECPAFDKFLEDIMCGDEELIEYKFRQYGYMISGATHSKAVFYHYGPEGNNGKSTETEILQQILGSYATTVSEELFLDQFGGGSEKAYELSRLPGLRLAICGEVDESKSWSESTVKKISGGDDKITARQIRQAPFVFKPVFKLLIHANNLPKVKAGDEAMWKRLHLIRYDMELAEDQIDVELGAKLLAEKEGILVKMAAGYREWKSKGLMPPRAVLDARAEYKAGAFSEIGEFVRDTCEVWRSPDDGSLNIFNQNGEELIETTSALFKEYGLWCRENNTKARSQNSFGRGLSSLGFGSIRKRPVVGEEKVSFRTKLRLKNSTSTDGFDELEDSDMPF